MWVCVGGGDGQGEDRSTMELTGRELSAMLAADHVLGFLRTFHADADAVKKARPRGTMKRYGHEKTCR